MPDDFSNPPLPGKGIEADPAEPPFTRAVRGEVEAKPQVLQQNLNLTPRAPAMTPDGRPVVPGRAENMRQQGIEARAQRIDPGIERDGAADRDLSKLQREFKDARDNRR